MFIAGDRYKSFAASVSSICRFAVTLTLILFILGMIFYLGFASSPENLEGLRAAFRIMFAVIFFSKYIPGILKFRRLKGLSLILRGFVFVFTSGVFLTNFGIISFSGPLWFILTGNISVIAAIIVLGISEVSGLLGIISSVKIPPALIFSASFLIIIFIGSGLLMMPKAHTGALNWLDSLFTSVSAVCVTGLVVVDTATAFTPLGKIIILCLIQIGGLGILTFTGFFGYIFTSGSSFSDNLLLKELFSAESMNNLLKLLTKILFLTFLIEIIGSFVIYSSLEPNHQDKILFSIFHSVSAFCNAGFSTRSGNLNSPDIQGNYIMLGSVAFLVILGGIGFPVLAGFYTKLKHIITGTFRRLQGKMKPSIPDKKNVSGNIVLLMTLSLILGGALLYFLFESENSMKGLGTASKFIISFFGSISARTAGFNMADISLWGYPTIFVIMFLMWVGASPGSTGGGIKTTTFALAFATVWNYIRGRDRLKIGNREVGTRTITRVLSIIFLSIIIISAGFFGLLLSEPGRDPVYLLFESFSAFGTVGLSLADSSTFSDAGKAIDIVLMFVGRVGPLTLLTGFFVTSRRRYSTYPEIEIVIN